VRDLLRTRLVGGEFGNGRLPDETRLMTEYDVGRNVVRGALSLLQQEGLITRTQGLGTFSITRKASLTLRDANGIASCIDGARTRVMSRIVSIHEMAAQADIANRLDVAVDALCLVVDLTTTIDGIPAVVLTSYIADPESRSRVKRAIAPGSWHGDWYDLLASIDLRPVRRLITAEAVGADDMVAPMLALTSGAPVMRCERTLSLGDEGTIEFGSSYCRGDVMALTMIDGIVTAGAAS
jgi:DNA-binding GntR family transcriptional regulator